MRMRGAVWCIKSCRFDSYSSWCNCRSCEYWNYRLHHGADEATKAAQDCVAARLY